ncbi:MAG: dihydrodipicolinate synthase family protein [Acidobacteria bacterium]|nr:dihydrodipicolinate synthase family protein [Acidobacteriota bacterium]
MNHRLDGLFPPVTTPFDEEGNLLISRFGENLDRWAAFDLAGLLVLGSNAETPCLSDEERLTLVRTARPRIPAEKSMIVGAGRESTRHTMEFIRRIADLGADYALVGMPCYFKPLMTEQALFAHYWTIADEARIPILIYSVPQFTGIHASAGLIEKLSAHENIAGMKDSGGSLPFEAEVRRRTHSRFKLLVGSALTLLPSLVQGANGGIVAISCSLPQMTIDLYQSFREGNWRQAAEIQERLAPLASAVTASLGIPGLKASLDLMGFYGGPPRPPLLPLDPDQRNGIAVLFRQAGVR